MPTADSLGLLRLVARFRLRRGRARASGAARVRARRAVALSLPALAVAVAALWSAAEAAPPTTPDDEYQARLSIARAAQAEDPARPLGLVLGTSRTTLAFRPEQLPDEGLCWVNGGRFGADPVFTRVLLRRFLRDGVRPAVVVLDVMPSFFVDETNALVAHLAPRDLPVARWYGSDPFECDRHVLRSRFRWLQALDPPPPPGPPAEVPAYLPRGGFPNLQVEITPEERARRTEMCRVYFARTLHNLAMRSVEDRAFRATVRAALDHGVRVVLLRSPEGPAFRSWYDPGELARFDAYVTRIASEYGVPVLDARLWLEEEDFGDSHHVLKRGADKFTARFAREIPALLTGR